MLNRYQEALNNVKRVYVESEHYDEEDIRLLQQLVDLHKKIKKDVEFLNSQDIQIFFLPNGKEILGYNITECPSRILLAESMRKNIEKILKCLNRSDEDDE